MFTCHTHQSSHVTYKILMAIFQVNLGKAGLASCPFIITGVEASFFYLHNALPHPTNSIKALKDWPQIQFLMNGARVSLMNQYKNYYVQFGTSTDAQIL